MLFNELICFPNYIHIPQGRGAETGGQQGEGRQQGRISEEEDGVAV